jgi:uncharacterized protein with HEPN domain
MPPERREPARLWDMLEAARNVVAFAQGRTYENYLDDLMLRSAVERQIEIVGEAARYISEATVSQHPEIPWDKIRAQRHVLAHEYGEIQHERIWRVVTVHLPELIKHLEPLIPPLPQEPEPPTA